MPAERERAHAARDNVPAHYLTVALVNVCVCVMLRSALVRATQNNVRTNNTMLEAIIREREMFSRMLECVSGVCVFFLFSRCVLCASVKCFGPALSSTYVFIYVQRSQRARLSVHDTNRVAHTPPQRKRTISKFKYLWRRTVAKFTAAAATRQCCSAVAAAAAVAAIRDND